MQASRLMRAGLQTHTTPDCAEREARHRHRALHRVLWFARVASVLRRYLNDFGNGDRRTIPTELIPR